MLKRAIAAGIAAVFVFGACASDADPNEAAQGDREEQSLRELEARMPVDICNDLRGTNESGERLSLFQVGAGGTRNVSKRQVAGWMLDAVENHCSEFEEDFKKSLFYTEWYLETPRICRDGSTKRYDDPAAAECEPG